MGVKGATFVAIILSLYLLFASTVVSANRDPKHPPRPPLTVIYPSSPPPLTTLTTPPSTSPLISLPLPSNVPPTPSLTIFPYTLPIPYTPNRPPITPYNCQIGKFSVCVDLLDKCKVVIGGPRSTPCCKLILGLIGFDAYACLCSALKANILGTIDDLDSSIGLLYNQCGNILPIYWEPCSIMN
jgi:hypothetical protein